MGKRVEKTKRELRDEGRKQRAEKIKNDNKLITLKNDLTKDMVQDFYNNFEENIEQRKYDFKYELDCFVRAHAEEITEKYGHIETIGLENFMCKPLAKTYGYAPKCNPDVLIMGSDYYWDCVAKTVESGINYIPTLQQFLRLMGYTTQYFKDLAKSPDDRMRYVVELIKDRFISYYTEKGMKKEMSEILAIFTLKSSYGLRDNDPPNYYVSNNRYTIQKDELQKIDLEIDKKLENIVIDGEVIDSDV